MAQAISLEHLDCDTQLNEGKPMGILARYPVAHIRGLHSSNFYFLPLTSNVTLISDKHQLWYLTAALTLDMTIILSVHRMATYSPTGDLLSIAQ